MTAREGGALETVEVFLFFFRFIGDPGKFPFFLNVKTLIPSIRAGPKVKANVPNGT